MGRTGAIEGLLDDPGCLDEDFERLPITLGRF